MEEKVDNRQVFTSIQFVISFGQNTENTLGLEKRVAVCVHTIDRRRNHPWSVGRPCLPVTWSKLGLHQT